MKPDKPPEHLSKESKKIWRELNQTWELEGDMLIILKTALESYDLMQQSREVIQRAGILIKSPSGVIRANPALRTLKETRGGFLQAWRMLNLGIEPPGEVGRPTR